MCVCRRMVRPRIANPFYAGSSPVTHSNGPIDYGLDPRPFKAENRVRVPVGLPIYASVAQLNRASRYEREG